MVYKLDAGTVIDAGGNLVIENLYAGSVSQKYVFQGSTSGYTSGGNPPGPAGNIIDKYPFASNANATDVGDTLESKAYVTGTSSTTYGYTMGGWHPASNIIQKHSFSTDGNSTDVGDLTAIKHNVAGSQH